MDDWRRIRIAIWPVDNDIAVVAEALIISGFSLSVIDDLRSIRHSRKHDVANIYVGLHAA
jgi:hypothetical protein